MQGGRYPLRDLCSEFLLELCLPDADWGPRHYGCSSCCLKHAAPRCTQSALAAHPEWDARLGSAGSDVVGELAGTGTIGINDPEARNRDSLRPARTKGGS